MTISAGIATASPIARSCRRCGACISRGGADCRGEDGKRFGGRPRHSLRTDELRSALASFAATARQAWPTTKRPAAKPSAATVRHYRTALFSLYTALDGKNAPNPLRDVTPLRSADAEPRAIPYAVIDTIFAAMPERSQGLKGVTRKGGRSKTKVRLRVMAYIGLPPAQIARLKPEHVQWDEATVLVLGRKKGKGTKAARLPLIPQGVAALRDLFALGAAGKFSTSSARTSWRRGIAAVVAQLAARDAEAARQFDEALKGARPYDLRHSYLTESYISSKDIRATQALAMHSDARMTERYTLAAVDPRLQDVAARLGIRLGVPADVPAKPAEQPRTSANILSISRRRRSGASASKTA
jgi:integrase